MQPKVSVIMPAYNAQKYIGFAIESILNQTYKNLELIIVEDCSTDDTLRMIQNYKDSRIKLLRNDFNRGISYSTNAGIDVSDGKYIALMDDDDVAVKERLALQVEYLEEHENIDILGGRSAVIDAKGNFIKFQNTPKSNPKYIHAVLLFNCMNFRNGTAMIRKEFVLNNNLYYQENCMGMQDYKFYIDSSKVGNISTIDRLLLYYRIHEQNETKRRKELYKKERAQLYAKFQRESLEASGFKLDTESMKLINEILAEYDGRCNSLEQFRKLYCVFREILKQAQEMNIDYYQELEHLCKSKLAEQLIKMDIFFDL